MSTPSARASGEFAFEQLFDAFKDERDYLGTKNFWFKSGSNGDREILKEPLPAAHDRAGDEAAAVSPVRGA